MKARCFQPADEARPERVGGQRRLETGGQQRQIVVDRRAFDLLQRLHDALADPARRHVDHPPEADVVVRVDDELQVGERVLDFLALVEPHAADDLVGEPLAHQRVLDRSRLRVGPIEHRDRGVHVVGQAGAGGARDEVGLLELVAAAEVDDARAAFALGPEVLVLAVAVLADDGRGRVEDDLRRSVVAFELDDGRLGKVLLEVEDVPQVGAAPLVDRLIGIADDAQVAVHLGEPADQQVLRPVRVLVLVHHDEAELAARTSSRTRCGLLEQLDRLEQEIVEVERGAVLQGLQVVARRPWRSARRAGSSRRPPPSAPGLSIRFLAWLMRESAARGWTKLSSMCSSLSACLTTRELVGRVVDDEIARQADGRRLAAQQACAERVERRDPHPAAVGAEQRFDAGAHLFGGLVRERDRQHLVRLGVAVADEVRDSARDDARLAGTGAGEDQQRSLDVQDRFSLFGVQGFEELHARLTVGRGTLPAQA